MKIPIIILFLITIAHGSLSALEKPYFQCMDSGRIVAIIESDKSSPIDFYYWEGSGKKKSIRSSFNKATVLKGRNLYFHRIFIKGLNPGTKYSYFIRQASQVKDGFLKTPPAGGDSIRLKFGVISNPQSNIENHKKLLNRLMSLKPDLLIYVGNLTQEGRAEEIYDNFLNKDVRSSFGEIPFLLTLGNNDLKSKDYEIFFEFPASHNNENYYSLSIGRNHFLSLNTHLSLKENSEQYRFAKSDLDSSRHKWKFVTMHKPLTDENVIPATGDMQRLIDSVFIPHGVDFVLSSHIHLFGKNLLRGVENFIIGFGDAEISKNNQDIKKAKTNNLNHFAIIETDIYTAFVRIIDINGNTIYSNDILQQF